MKCLRAICLFVLCLSILVLVSPAQAEEHSITVYRYCEDTGEWVPVDEENGVSCTISSSFEFYGTTSSSTVQITARALVDIDNQEKTFSQNAITVQNTYPNPGIFSITVEPLTDNVEIIEDDSYDYDFLMRKLKERAAWRFTYRVENISENEVMNDIVVKDNFGAELDIYKDSFNQGSLDITVQGAREKYFFEWSGFSLGPGESAELTIKVELGKNPAGIQSYSSCDDSPYDLNSGGTLKYTIPGKPGLQTKEGYNFKVHVDCRYICIEFSATVIEWFIRKPGDYYAKTATASVESSKPIVVTFSEFDVLRGDYDRTLDVRYAFNDALVWYSPDELNEHEMVLDMVGGVDGFDLWQRVILNNQQPCTYENEGVITFSIANSETSIF